MKISFTFERNILLALSFIVCGSLKNILLTSKYDYEEKDIWWKKVICKNNEHIFNCNSNNNAIVLAKDQMLIIKLWELLLLLIMRKFIVIILILIELNYYYSIGECLLYCTLTEISKVKILQLFTKLIFLKLYLFSDRSGMF